VERVADVVAFQRREACREAGQVEVVAGGVEREGQSKADEVAAEESRELVEGADVLVDGPG
jgi:hypothetical protein